MEEEKEEFGDSASGVRISITRASLSEDEGDFGKSTSLQRGDEDNTSSDEEEVEKILREEEEKEQLVEGEEEPTNSTTGKNNSSSASTTAEEEGVSRAFENSVSISEEGDVESHMNGTSGEKEDINEALRQSSQIEVVGDRVLIERDGKFELVDVNEIKAEYFEMLGISPDKSEPTSEPSDNTSVEVNECDKDKSPERKTRPKTTSLHELLRRNEIKATPAKNRSKSAKTRSRKDEFAHLKSPYGMTEQQIEIKRKREEAIARRKKEEEERRREEARRKREDAERAFQAWLNAKKEEAKERRQEEERRKPDPSIQRERLSSAKSAYGKWLEEKRTQTKLEQRYEKSRQEDEAAQYLIRDRGLCDEAFQRWLRKKNAEARAKNALRRKKKPKLKRKEQPPHNSEKIRYYEYYGYRNTVVH